MTHDEARLLIGSAPQEVSALLAEHLAHCAECTLFQQQMRQIDVDLTRLFTTPLPQGAGARVLTLPVMTRSRVPTVSRGFFPGVMTLAASLVLCAGLTILFWALRPQPSLAGEVLGHVALESGSWSTVAPMTATATDAVLAGAGVSLDPSDLTITYARTCLFNGHWVPHLVVHTPTGPVTVMVLPQEHLAARQSFRQNGYSGILVPTPAGGTLAVIVQGTADLDAVAAALEPHLHWNP